VIPDWQAKGLPVSCSRGHYIPHAQAQQPPRILPAAVPDQHRRHACDRCSNYTVEEISERGLRLSSATGSFALDTPVQGTLMLTAGVRCTVTGTVLRVEEKCVVLKLSRGPTSYDVIREQRHVARNFPDWKPQSA
jgi:hypothetical protein